MDAIINSLRFDALVFGLQIVLFLVLWTVMSAVFWKPMLAHLQGRDQEIKDAYHSVEQTRHEMEQLRADYQTHIAQIEAEARGRIQTAIKEAQAERERTLAEARTQAEAAIRQGIENMEREKAESLNALRESMVGLAVSAAGKALGSAADPVVMRRAIEDRIASGLTNGANPARN